ncbi:polymeric immunoglobulin receptor-like isoform X2 [Boleophthalmus pectinirostris]|uniref:polymeric immunoglobulin receptor-like isoform X2 n=1 Tax=Boleophthalmus pectinirostris TaxID=150288 RepID=UPI00242E9C9B|nr:polymeric immunoglobulin receptor-like isoform X2 [Boleophthalmus pectinirostris]
MATFVTFFFICAGLSGINSLETVGHIMIEAEGTVHIPCHYEAAYTDHVKYLCRDASWNNCKTKIRSKDKNSTKYSIYDDKVQRIVTFTVKNLELNDSDVYWCIIEKAGTDDGKTFRLSVTRKAESNLSVDSQWVLGYFDDQITIQCKCNGSDQKTWCRFGGRCIHTSGILNKAQISIDTRDAGVFAVTMTGLKADDIGWYWCGFGDLQMPVFLDLTIRPTTITSIPEPGSISMSDTLIAAAIALGLLILIIIVSLVAWCTLKRKMKETKGKSSSSPECVDNPVYSNVTTKQASHQNTDAAKDDEVLYNSVTFMKRQCSKEVAVTEEDVLYSTLAQR